MCYNIVMEREHNTRVVSIKNNKLAGVIIIVAGALLIGGAFFVHSTESSAKQRLTEKVSGSLETDGMYTNTDGELMYEPTYLYRINNKEYHCKENSSNSEPPKTTDVFYNQSDPDDCKTAADYNNSSMVYGILFGLGGVVVIAGLATVMMKPRSESSEEEEEY